MTNNDRLAAGQGQPLAGAWGVIEVDERLRSALDIDDHDCAIDGHGFEIPRTRSF